MFNIKDSQVYKETKKRSSIIKVAIGNINIIMIKNTTTQPNTLTQIPIIYQTFDLAQQQYVVDESINKTVDVYVNGELATTEDIVNGEGAIQFESAEAGTFIVKVENAECEVVVNG